MKILRLAQGLALTAAATLVQGVATAQTTGQAPTLVTAQANAPLPVELFFRKAAFRSPKLSPSGKQIAMLVPTSSGRVGLAVASIDSPDKLVGIAQFDDSDVRSFSWVNDKRLVFDAFDQQATLGDQIGSGLYAVDSDGSNFIWLIERTGNYRTVGNPSKRPLPARNRYVGPLHDGSDDVLIQRWVPEGGITSIMMRLNTRSMGASAISTETAPNSVQSWELDQNHQPRAALALDGKQKLAVYWRDIGSAKWEKLTSYSIFDPDENSFTPVAVDRDNNLYVTSVGKGSKDKVAALYRYDVSKRKLDDQPLVSIPGFDFEGRLLFDSVSKKMLGASFLQDAPGVVWFDQKMRDTQHDIDKQLPNTINTISCSRCEDAANLVVMATSDVQAPIYFLYSRESKKLKLLANSYPWLDSRQMAGTTDFLRVKARDGMEIPVYVTKPKGKGPFPTVILVHGGPNVRGVEWGFNPSNQFLASRGYVVVEPEFRGSKGYGDILFKAGWKQWGLAMQDDVTDVTRWAIDTKLADADKIAIAGASYGGYATMMGLLKEPKLYKAGVNWVGVTDIALMYSIDWSDFQSADSPWVRYGMPIMIGDKDKDAAQFTATSPLKNAAKITQPVLMAYGEEDYRVPLPHGTKMRDALIATGNKNVEWVQYAGEGHGFMLTKNNVDFWTRVEKFLDKHVKQ